MFAMLQNKKQSTPEVVPLSDDLDDQCHTICSFLDQFIVSQYGRAYSTFIEEVDLDLGARTSATYVDVPPTTLQLEAPQGHVLETLILGEECPDHLDSGHIPVFVCEQWVFKHLCNCSSDINERSIEQIQQEITSYFTSSPLSFWLKEHYQSKRYKLAHRMCTIAEASQNLGASFILPMGQISSISSVMQPKPKFNSCCTKKCGSASHSPSASHILSTNNSTVVDPWLSHTFSPVHFSVKGVLNLSVLSPKWMPAHLLECPLCSYPRIEYFEEVSQPSITNPQTTTPRKLPPPVDTRTCESTEEITDVTNVPKSFPGVSTHSSGCKETLKSPTVVMTDVHNNFFHDVITDSLYDIPFFSVSGIDSNSATSTLTKKSRINKLSDNAQHPQLESPPRKQQRIGSETNISGNHETPQASPPRLTEQFGTNHNRGGTMDKVIAEFTQLNVERVDLCSGVEASSCEGSTVEHFCTSTFYSPLGLADRPCDTDFPDTGLQRGVAKKREHHPKSSSSDSSGAMTTVYSRSDHLPRERRRNATSACIPTWSSSLQKDGQPFFNRRTGLPLQSSPVPLKRSTSGRFDFDSSLCSLKGSKSSTCMIYGLDNPQSERPETREDSSGCDPLGSTRDLPNGSSSVQLRRRPASLRLHVPSNVQNGRHEVPVRRRTCAPEVDQAEISCSAPPSGDRGSLHSSSHSRMANTLACTPLSHSSSQHLLVNFEESMLNGRIHPVGQVEGFTLELGASGSFFPAHERIPMKAYFFDLSDDNKPSPYLGYADLCQLRNGKGYHLPMKGSVQLTLFNPNKVVVKMFVIGYDFEDMPRNSQTFLRQRTVYMPIQRKHNHQEPTWNQKQTNEDQGDTKYDFSSEDRMLSADLFGPNSKQGELLLPSSSVSSCSCSSLSSISSGCSLSSLSSNLTVNSSRSEQHACLRYLVHLRFHTTRSGRLYLHTDIRLIFARDKFEFDPRVANYELRSFIDAPTNPRYSPKKWTKRPRTSMPFVPPRITSP